MRVKTSELRQGVPLNYSSRITGQSVRGSRGGNLNEDEGVIMDRSTSVGW